MLQRRFKVTKSSNKYTKQFGNFSTAVPHLVDVAPKNNNNNNIPLLESGRKFSLISSLFPRKSSTISFLDEEDLGGKVKPGSIQTHHIVANIYDEQPLFKLTNNYLLAVRIVFLESGLKRTRDDDWNIFFGKHIPHERYKEMNPFQRYNHFPRSILLGRKDLLALSLRNMKNLYGAEEFSFFPLTFLLPQERELYDAFCSMEKKHLFIYKPPNSSCGRGIGLQKASDPLPTAKPLVVQSYLSNPLLLKGGYKFDMRLYVLVTSFEPLRIYLFDDGLTRLSTEKYDNQKLRSIYAHLTNYTINKRSPKFQENTDEVIENMGHKWSIKALKQYLDEEGVMSLQEQEESFWKETENVIIKTLLSVEEKVKERIRTLKIHRNSCFELYGFDILIDDNMKPWLLEVNVLPSLECPTPLDRKIKVGLLKNIFHLIGITPYNRVRLEEETKKLNYLDEVDTTIINNVNINTSNILGDSEKVVGGRAGSVRLGERMELKKGDIYMLQESEDELNRLGNFKRIFPTPDNAKSFDSFWAKKSKSNKVLAAFEKAKLNYPLDLLHKTISFS